MGIKHRVYGETKAKRHVYLTDTIYSYLGDLAKANDLSSSEVCEQILRWHMTSALCPPTTSTTNSNDSVQPRASDSDQGGDENEVFLLESLKD